MSKSKELKEKVVLVGEVLTGKTCIIKKAICDTFKEDEMGVYVAINYLLEVSTDSGKKMKLDIWDTAGQEKFRAVNRIFYKNARAVLMVYDITQRKTFDVIKKYWVEQAKTCACLNVVLGVLGNKSDLFENEEVTEEEAKEFAESIGAFFMLTSAKHGTGIHEAFKEAAEMIEKAGPIQERTDGNGTDAVKLEEQKKPIKKKCF